jgi:hypothetical protein
MDIFEQLSPPAIHGELEAGRAASVRKELVRLAKSIQVSTFDQATLFHEVQTNSYFLKWGYASLGEYATKELGIKERKAQYLAKIVKVCTDLGLNREAYEPAGISKLREIVTLDPKGFHFDNEENKNYPLDELMVDLILDAPEMTLQQVKDKVAEYKGQVGKERIVMRNFGITESCWEHTIAPALELAARKLGSAGRDEAGNAVEYSMGAKLEIICASFMQDPNNFMEDSEIPNE